jgi:hypothetical protein
VKLFDSGRHQEKAALASTKADFPSLPEAENLQLSAQKQLLEPPLIVEPLDAIGQDFTQLFL